MADFPRREQLFRIFAAELLDANDELALSAVLEDGLDANLLANACAAMGEEVIGQLARVEANSFLESSTGPALIRRGFDRHQILPRPASPAFVDLTFSVPTAVVTAFTILAGTSIRSADGKQYVTVADALFAVGATSLTGVRARSVLAGRSQTVAPFKLTSITSTITGAPAGLTVTNPSASSGAMDAEIEDDYRRRCRQEPRSRARGTRDALEFGSLSVPGVIRATPFEGIDTNGRANRIAGIVVADEFTDTLVRQGASTPTYETQSQAFARVVEQSLNDWRAWGIHVGVFVAQVIMVSFLLRLRFRAGADTDRARIEATATIVRAVNELAPGASIDPAVLIERLRAVNGLDVRGDEIENPVGLVVPSSPYQVLRTTQALIQYTSQPAQGSFSILTTA